MKTKIVFLWEAQAGLEPREGTGASNGPDAETSAETSAETGTEPGSVSGPVKSEAEQALRRRLTEAGLDGYARDNLVALLREQHCATGVLPTDETLVLERNRDESGS